MWVCVSVCCCQESQSFDHSGTLDTMKKTLKVAFANVDDARINFDGMAHKDELMDMQQLLNVLESHFMKSKLKLKLGLFGSLSVFGNPTGIYHNIKDGFDDFGEMKSPRDVGTGAAKGFQQIKKKINNNNLGINNFLILYKKKTKVRTVSSETR